MTKNNFLKLISVLIAVCALADTNFELLKSVGLSDIAINYVKLLGLLMALVLPSVSNLNIFSKEGEPDLPPVEDEGIGGGGIKNPKP